MEHPYYSDWYAKNRDRLIPIRRKYNKEYTKRPEVVAKAKIKNMELREHRRAYKKTISGKIAEKKYRDNHKEEIRTRSEIHRLRRYGLTPEKVAELKVLQNNLCLICESSILVKFHIDHSHITGKVRGLLCTPCNMGLGLFKDSRKLLERAIEYLK